MFENIVRSFLGDWGSVVLDFYISNQLIINLVILTWGITIMVLRRKKRRAAENGPIEEKKE